MNPKTATARPKILYTPLGHFVQSPQSGRTDTQSDARQAAQQRRTARKKNVTPGPPTGANPERTSCPSRAAASVRPTIGFAPTEGRGPSPSSSALAVAERVEPPPPPTPGCHCSRHRCQTTDVTAAGTAAIAARTTTTAAATRHPCFGLAPLAFLAGASAGAEPLAAAAPSDHPPPVAPTVAAFADVRAGRRA